MPKILYLITQSEGGGAQRYVLDLAENLKPEFEIAAAFGEPGEKGELATGLKRLGVKTFAIPHLKRRISPLNDWLAFFEIKKIIKQFRPDIIHLNSSKISILGSLAAAGFKARVIYTAHGWIFNEPLPAWQKLFYLIAEKLTAGFKDMIICVSEFDRRTALEHKIAPPEKLITIHNGLAFCHSGLRARNASLARRAGDPESSKKKLEQISGSRIKSGMTNQLLIGSIGNLYKTKGYEYFIKAADILINQYGLKANFVIIGAGAEKNHLKNLIKKFNLEKSFFLTGGIIDAAKLLPAFSLYVCSSVKEGLSYTLIEAMQAGLPIIATTVGGNAELIEDGISGLAVAPANAEALAQKIKKLLDRADLRQAYGQKARLKAQADYALLSMIEKTRSLYK